MKEYLSMFQDMQDGFRVREHFPATIFVRWPWVAAIVVLLRLGVASQAEDGHAKQGVENNPAETSSLERMRHCAESLIVRSGENEPRETATLQDRPLLHYTDPAGITTDATIWVWGKVGRPVALAGIFFERISPTMEKWSCEWTALADEPLSAQGRPGWKWEPTKSDLALQSVPDSPSPADSARLRTRQMSELARRFSVSETFSEEKTDQLRLMAHPLYRYADAEHGLVDGALYAFANGTNPEVLLVLECRTGSAGKAAWHYGFGRLGAAQLQARLNDAVVWQRPGIGRWSSVEPYFSVFGPRDSVFGDVEPEPCELDGPTTPGD